MKMASQEEGSKANLEHDGTDEQGSWWTSWGKSLVDTVKEKTSSTYEMVQKDLSEFYQTIQTDTAHVVVDTASKVQDQIKATKDESEEDPSQQSTFKQGFASILSSVSESLKTLAQEEAPSQDMQVETMLSSPVYDRRLVKIHEIQTEVGTYCNEPEGLEEVFLNWEKSFDFDSKRSEMSDLLVKVPEIRAVYSKLVPSVVSHGKFWKRYFFKIHQFEMGEKRRAALVARAETASLHEEEYNWDSDDVDETTEDEPGDKSQKTVVEVQVHSRRDDYEETRKSEEDVATKDEQAEQSSETSATGETGNSKDEHSFEVLSPTKSEENNVDNAISPTEEYHREISDGSLSWSNEGDDVEVTEASEIDAGFSSIASSRLSPSKEDSSSGSSVEVIQKVRDEPSRTIAKDTEISQGVVSDAKSSINDRFLDVRAVDETRLDHSETASTSSWISVDDEIRVRKSKKEKFINEKGTEITKSPESNRNSGSSSSSAVLVEKSECKSLEEDDNDDVDIDLDEDINDEELQKIMEKIKNKTGDLDDDDDWEDWE